MQKQGGGYEAFKGFQALNSINVITSAQVSLKKKIGYTGPKLSNWLSLSPYSVHYFIGFTKRKSVDKKIRNQLFRFSFEYNIATPVHWLSELEVWFTFFTQ